MAGKDENLNNRSLELCRRTVTTESFIAEAKEIYGNHYDYSKVDYKNRDHRVTIVCPVHGDFQVYAREHLDGKGCPKCEKGEKFLAKLKEKFGDKFGLDEYVYESSTSPVTLICPTHGAFSRLPHQILNSSLGCPECANKVKEDIHHAAIERKEAAKEEKRKAREEFEAQRLNGWLEERAERERIRERALKSFLAGKEPRDFYSPYQIYQGRVDEHIEGIRYGGWKTSYYAPYKLSDDEAMKLSCYRVGDHFYKFPNEAPDDFFRQAYEKDYAYYGGSIEQHLSHRSCIVSFEGNDLIIQEESYDHEIERFKTIEPIKETTRSSTKIIKELPVDFVSIDFETLYPQRVSACSVGMVKYKNGEIVDRYYTLISPPFDYPGKCGKVLTWIHGLTEDMVKDARTFAEILPEMEKFAEGLPLVAHNACVERACIRDASTFYGVETTLDYENIYDTLDLSRLAESKLGIFEEGPGTHQLDTVCKRFGVPGNNHHNALADAEMAGNLMVIFQNIFGEGESVEVVETSSFHQKKYNPEDKVQRTDLDNIADNPFKNQVVVLTGFAKADSQEYAHKLNELGAIIKEGVNKKTNILITGYNAGPSKMQKAQEFGARIMSEEEFKEIINQL